MREYPYYLVNVFAESHFGGNPLAVFYQADELSQQEMQLIARQFNLSEVVFIQSPTDLQAVKKLKIFTPDREMPFAGHPTIGAAFILHSKFQLPTSYTLQTNAGFVDIQHQNDLTTLALKNGVEIQPSPLSRADCAEMLGLTVQDIAGAPAIVNTGVAQLLIKLASRQAIENCQINARLFEKMDNDSLYVWYRENNQANVRLFFRANGMIVEDPGTGSAAANLAGWHIANGVVPLDLTIYQGDDIDRPNRLRLKVDEQKTIFVGGNVIEVGQGVFYLPKR